MRLCWKWLVGERSLVRNNLYCLFINVKIVSVYSSVDRYVEMGDYDHAAWTLLINVHRIR